MENKAVALDVAAINLFSSTFYTLLNAGIETDDAINSAIKAVDAFYAKFGRGQEQAG